MSDGAMANPPADSVEDPSWRFEEISTIPDEGSVESAPRRRHVGCRTLLVGTAALVAAVGLVVGFTGPGANDAAAQVTEGTLATLSQTTAALTISGSFVVAGQTLPVTGTGLMDFSSKVAQLNISISGAGSTVQESEIYNAATIYLSINANGNDEVSSLVPGKHWVQMAVPVGATGGIGATTSNPLSQLQLLAKQGNTVTSIGSTSINGASATGYRVTISRQVLTNASKRMVNSNQYSAAIRQAIVKSASTMSPPVIEVWFGSNHLLLRETVTLRQTVSGQSMTGAMTIDFAQYGSPVTIAIPPAGDSVSLNDFIAAAGASSSTSG